MMDKRSLQLVAAAIALGGSAGAALMLGGVQLHSQEKPVYQLADLIEPSDCAQRGSYGGQNRVLCDLAPALNRALAACYASVSTWTGDADVQCQIEGPSGLFYFGSTVELCHGGKLSLGSAKIFSAPGVTPIVGPGFQACRDRGLTSGIWTIQDIGTMRPYSVTPPGVIVRGFDLKGPHRLRNIRLHNYTQGIRITANATSTTTAQRANANGWVLEQIGIQGSEHAGIWIDGPDVNVGVATRVGVTSSCGSASLLGHLGPCADIYDGSFLGCTWIAASTGYAEDAITGTVYPGIVLGDSANSRSVCLGCYIESGYGGGQAAAVTNVLGGIGGWTGPGNRLEGNRISALESVGSDGTMSVKLGSLTGGGALTLTPIGDSGSYPLRFKYSTTNAAFFADVGNIGGAQVLRIGAKNTTPTLGLGGLMLRPNNSLPNVFYNTTGYIVPRQTP